MLNRLVTFAITLLLLPPIALTLAGLEWSAPPPVAGTVALPALLVAAALLAFGFLLDTLTFRRTGHSLLRSQRNYLLWSGVAGTMAGTLMAYLNLFATAWLTPGSNTLILLLAALLGTVLLPVILVTRLWLAGLPGLVRLSARRLPIPALPPDFAAILLLAVALGGLLGGPVWTDVLGWLYWISPLLLLAALQLLWNENTLFSGLEQGDWSRILLGTLTGIVVGGFALAIYRLGGGALYLASGTGHLIAGLAVFGLLCMQIGEAVAEHWRGKARGEVFKKKTIPISVVSRKEK